MANEAFVKKERPAESGKSTARRRTNKAFAKHIEQRTRQFAARVIEISRKLPDTPEGRIIKNQFTKASTSVGANYREANRSWSQRDFLHKMHLCETECAEVQYYRLFSKNLRF